MYNAFFVVVVLFCFITAILRIMPELAFANRGQ